MCACMIEWVHSLVCGGFANEPTNESGQTNKHTCIGMLLYCISVYNCFVLLKIALPFSVFLYFLYFENLLLLVEEKFCISHYHLKCSMLHSSLCHIIQWQLESLVSHGWDLKTHREQQCVCTLLNYISEERKMQLLFSIGYKEDERELRDRGRQ